MEKIFDEAKMLMDAVEENPSKLMEYQPEISKLAEYYESAQWKADFEDDEAGKLPKKLKRGVLSEDGIYDLLERNSELIR